jgi:hypothetical protein
MRASAASNRERDYSIAVASAAAADRTVVLGSLEDDGVEGRVAALRAEGLREAAPPDKAVLFRRRCTNPNERFERVNFTRKAKNTSGAGAEILDPEPYPFKLQSGLE